MWTFFWPKDQSKRLEYKILYYFYYIVFNYYNFKIIIRFDELKSAIKDKKKIAVKELWREFQRNLTLVDTIPSIIVDELIVPWDRCRRQPDF